MLCDHLEGWDREGGKEMREGGDMGIYVYIELIHLVVQQKHNIVKQLYSNKDVKKKNLERDEMNTMLTLYFQGSVGFLSLISFGHFYSLIPSNLHLSPQKEIKYILPNFMRLLLKCYLC